jgi:hypothetical protein
LFIRVGPPGQVSNHLLEDYNAILNFMNAEIQYLQF